MCVRVRELDSGEEREWSLPGLGALPLSAGDRGYNWSTNFTVILDESEGASKLAEPKPDLARGMGNLPIEELELGVRTYNFLKRVGIETIGDLVSKTAPELGNILYFGKKGIEEVRETLATHGLYLQGETPE